MYIATLIIITVQSTTSMHSILILGGYRDRHFIITINVIIVHACTLIILIIAHIPHPFPSQ